MALNFERRTEFRSPTSFSSFSSFKFFSNTISIFISGVQIFFSQDIQMTHLDNEHLISPHKISIRRVKEKIYIYITNISFFSVNQYFSRFLFEYSHFFFHFPNQSIRSQNIPSLNRQNQIITSNIFFKHILCVCISFDLNSGYICDKSDRFQQTF